MKRRRIEIVTVERERIVLRPSRVNCPVCFASSDLLTTAEAAVLAHVKMRSIYRWLSDGRAHGIRTCGGRYRVCRDSIFKAPPVSKP